MMWMCHKSISVIFFAVLLVFITILLSTNSNNNLSIATLPLVLAEGPWTLLRSRKKDSNRAEYYFHQFQTQSSLEEECYDDTTTTTTTTTQIGIVGKAFEDVLYKNHDSAADEDSNIDVNQLIKASQIFATVMRETGQATVARDLEGNIQQIEQSMTKMIMEMDQQHQQKPHKPSSRSRSAGPAWFLPRSKSSESGRKRKHNNDNRNRTSLESLLRYEVKQGIHKPGGMVQNPSGAIGSLWIRRSLTFQSAFYEGMLRGKTPPTSALDSYKINLQPFHGWALQKIYKAGLKTFSPSSKHDALRKIGGFDRSSARIATKKEDEEEAAVERDLNHLLDVWRPLLKRWKQIHVELDLEDTRQV